MSDTRKEPIYLAIVSGKGGSGKTTLALSLAALISKCGKKVLLFDCDSVTNGATYFFEKNKNKKLKGMRTTEDYIYNAQADESTTHNTGKTDCFGIGDYFGFVPSITEVTKEYSQKTGTLSFSGIEGVVEQVGADIVIFDCQAGYSAVTKFLLKHASIKLVVLEAEAISISAIRVLQAKLPHVLERKTTYQIMNKIQPEEYALYSGDRVDLLFPNLNPIIFDLNIRKCFAQNKLPTIDVNNFRFSIEICDLACALFPEFRKEILETRLELFYQKERSAKDALATYEAKEKIQKPVYFIWFAVCLLIIMGLYTLICITLTDAAKTSGVLLWGILGAVFLDIVLALTFRNAVPAETEEEALEHRENEDLLHKLDSQIAEMESELKTCANETEEDD